MPVHPPPHRVGVVRVGLGQAELALEQAGAAGRVHHPARAQGMAGTVMLETDRVRAAVLGQFHPARHRAIAEVRAQFARTFAEVVLEAAAVELPRRRRQQRAHAHLRAVLHLVHAFAEEVAQAVLAHLLRLHVLAQAQHLGEVVRADLDGGLADLVRGLADRMRAPL